MRSARGIFQVQLTPEQAAQYEGSAEESYHLEEALLEALQEQEIEEPVIVINDDGSFLFAVYKEAYSGPQAV
jgi:hypothetical protein